MMCGLVGVMGKIFEKEKNIFHMLLELDVIRGRDSTGISLITNKNKALLLKGALLPQQLLFSTAYQNLYKKNEHSLVCMMGHNRAATTGEINNKNSHPFRHGNIVLAHNGTLKEKNRLSVDKSKFDTDSEQITYTMSKKKEQYVWSHLVGAAALSWWDRAEQSLNLITNGQRPLHIAYSKDYNTVIWASEQWMLDVVISKFKYETAIEGGADVFYLPRNKRFKFKYIKNVLKKTTLELKPVPPTPITYYYPKNPIPQRYGFTPLNQGDKKRDVLEEIKNKMSDAAFNERYPSCSLCGMDLAFLKDTAKILDTANVICEDCYKTCLSDEIDPLTLIGWT